MASKLFTPIKVGNIELEHRIVMAPLTRYRADANGVHHETGATYYAQRASKGGLQITEATFIREEAGGYIHVPGIWSQPQIEGWKNVTDGVHAKGGYIFLQMWALGRAADADTLRKQGHPFVSASDVPINEGGEKPRPLTKEEIYQYVEWYAEAAKNAVFGAGFDGVEIHDANGYLLDQFVQDVSNHRTDEFGGSIENRTRFSLMVAKAVTDAIGQERVGIRLSPFSTFQSMKMRDPVPTFSYLIRELRDRFPNFAYIHLTEARVGGSVDLTPQEGESLDVFRNIWSEKNERTFLVAGGFKPDTAEETIQKYGGAVVFGRYFISNPDLPYRIRNKLELTPYERKTFYIRGVDAVQGYIDYPAAQPVVSEEKDIPPASDFQGPPQALETVKVSAKY